MEQNYQTNNPNAGRPAPETRKKVPMYLIAIVVTLAVIATLLGIQLYRYNTELAQSEEYRAIVESEKSRLEEELNTLIVEYDSLRTENDTMNLKLEAEQQKIRKLLRINASNATKLKMYQRELETLRSVMRSYIVQIDSLNTRNRELTAENIEVRQQLKQVETDYEVLSEEKAELTSVVALAQKLSAKNVLAEGLNNNSKPKNKISKIAKIRVCFTVRENSVAEAGSKMIYVRIQRPDEVVLSSPEAGLFEFQGEPMVYSAKRELEYDNQDIELCIYWDKMEELIPGDYFVSLYSEGHEIGTTSFVLK